MPHKFDPKNIDKLESPQRLSILPPEDVLVVSGLKPGDRIIDIGAGSGYFSIPAAAMTGLSGSITAVDPSPEMAAYMENRIRGMQLPNIEIILSKEYDFMTGDKKFDFAFISMVLHEIDDKPRFLAAVHKVLDEGGRVAIVEWIRKDMDAGPPAVDRIDEIETADLLRAGGFSSVSPLIYSAFHYIVTAKK